MGRQQQVTLPMHQCGLLCLSCCGASCLSQCCHCGSIKCSSTLPITYCECQGHSVRVELSPISQLSSIVFTGCRRFCTRTEWPSLQRRTTEHLHQLVFINAEQHLPRTVSITILHSTLSESGGECRKIITFYLTMCVTV